MKARKLIAAATCVVTGSAAGAGTINVGPGESIQDAIDAAASGQEIVVAPGTYLESIDFGGKAVTVRSSGGAAVTTIDAQGTGRVVQCTGGEGPGTVLEGFTITGGHADGAAFDDKHGAGIIIDAAGPTVRSCEFVGNDATTRGGGMYCVNGANPVISDCVFSLNTAYYGGGIYNNDSTLTLTGCTFSDNDAVSRAGALYGNAGATTAFDCVFLRNNATTGGALYNSSSSPELTNCRFYGNGPAPLGGGAIFNIGGSHPVLINCVLAGNFSDCGGAIFNNSGAPLLINCSLVGNEAVYEGGALNTLFGAPVLRNCVVWGNQPDQLFVDAITVAYSCVQGGFAGDANVGGDPLLVRSPDPGGDGDWGTPDDDYGDLHPTSGSACADAGNNWALPMDGDDYDDDGHTTELFPRDLDGAPRFAAATPESAGTGCGTPVIVDMGAYELAAVSQPVLFADFTGDGVVSVLDLLDLLGYYDADPLPDHCVLDLDLDGSISITELLTLLGQWGASL